MSILHQQIIDAIVARLAAIQTAAGYYTDAGNYVDEWREVALTNLAMHLNVQDGTETIDSLGESGPLGWWNRTLAVRVIAECSATATEEEYQVLGKMISDVRKAVGVDPTWSGLALYTDIDNGTPEHKQAEKKLASQTLTLTVHYYTAPGSPDDTPIAQSYATVAAPSADKVTSLLEQYSAQAHAAFTSGDTWISRDAALNMSEIPMINVVSEASPADAESVSGADNIETKRLTVKATALYKSKDNLATLRAEKEALLTAIETDPKLGGLALDCIPKEAAFEMDQDEAAIIGATVTHEVLYQNPKWSN